VGHEESDASIDGEITLGGGNNLGLIDTVLSAGGKTPNAIAIDTHVHRVPSL
jgi:hypothetical protein